MKAPPGWRSVRLRYLCEINPAARRIAGPIAFVPMDCVGVLGDIRFGQVLEQGDASAGLSYFEENDVIVAKITPCFENGKCALAANVPGGRALGSTEFHVIRPSSAVFPRFLFYVCVSNAFREPGEAQMYGAAGQKRVPTDFVKDFSLSLPERSEQQRIVEFLDRETLQIDSLLKKKQRLIELLDEKRAALIGRAVTKGLNPAVPMKDSGIIWLGNIPVHWKVARLKYAARLRTGHTPSRIVPEYWENCTIPWVSLADVHRFRDGLHDRVFDTKEKISRLGLANSAACLLPAGTVIFSRTASVGFSAILGHDMATTQDFVNWTCGPSLIPEYLLYCFRAMASYLRALTMGSTHQTIYMPDVEGFTVPVPPVSEQQAIAVHVLNRRDDLAKLVAAIREQINKLWAYRSALITGAVTGQLDIREHEKKMEALV